MDGINKHDGCAFDDEDNDHDQESSGDDRDHHHQEPGYGLYNLMAKANPQLIISMSGKGGRKKKRGQGSTRDEEVGIDRHRLL